MRLMTLFIWALMEYFEQNTKIIMNTIIHWLLKENIIYTSVYLISIDLKAMTIFV